MKLSDVVTPDANALEAIRATGSSGMLFFREVGPYRLSVIYRRSSAVAAWDAWYPESMIRLNGRIEYQGEGWSDFRLFHCLETEDAVTSFLTPEPDEPQFK